MRKKMAFLVILLLLITSNVEGRHVRSADMKEMSVRGDFNHVGNNCFMSTTRVPGICRISTDCAEVEKQGQNGIPPTICGYFHSTIPIVCCEIKSFSDTADFHSPPSQSSSNDRENGIVYVDSSQVSSNNHVFSSGTDSDIIVYPSEFEHVNTTRISEKKCQIYTKPLSDVVQAIPLLTETDVVNIDVEKCENNGVPLIVGGRPAAAGEFPFMAALGFSLPDEIEWRCGATLISEYYVITAAHCCSSRDANGPVVVRLGEIDITKENRRGRHVDYDIEEIKVHPGYRPPQKYNDIALIRVNRKINFSKYIRPACLYTKSHIKEAKSLAIGYGKNEFAAAENFNKLMKVLLNIYNNDKCSRVFGTDRRNLPRGIISDMLCAGEVKGGKDTCQGDSGGPLLITDKNNQCKFYLIGITSFGKSCGEVNAPGVYTKVSSYIKWIEDIVWP